MRRDKARTTIVFREFGFATITDALNEQPDELPTVETGHPGATYVKTRYLPITVYSGEPVPQGIVTKGIFTEKRVVPLLADEIVPHNFTLRFPEALVPTKGEAK